MIKEVIGSVGEFLDSNSPAVLLFTGCVLAVGAVFQAFNAKPKIIEALEEAEDNLEEGEELSKKEKVKIFVKKTWLIAVLFVGAMACIAFSNRLVTKQSIAFATGYKILEKELEERELATEKVVGSKKSEAIEQVIASDTVAEKGQTDFSGVIQTQHGHWLYLDKFSGRYFRSNIDSIKNALNDFNAKLLRENYMSLNDLYYSLDIGEVEMGNWYGYECPLDSPHPDTVQMRVTYTNAPNGEPCGVIKFTKPKPCGYYGGF